MERAERTGAQPPITGQTGPDGRSPQAERLPRSMGFTEMKTWLRHRHPIIMLDRVLDYEPGEYLTSLMSVSGQADAIAGHFPDRAIYPASHLIQAFAQSCIILLQLSTSVLTDDELTLVGSTSARFSKIVVPGDQVLFHVRSDRIRGKIFTFSGRADVSDVTVARYKNTLVRLRSDELGDPLW